MKTVRSVERAMAILFLVARSDQPLRLSEIGRSVDLDKATSLRLLNTLEAHGLIQQEPTSRRFLLGPRVGELINSWRSDLRNLCRPQLERLLHLTHETVCLSAPRGLDRVIIEALPAMHELRIQPSIGSMMPIHVGATGKVMVAFMQKEDIERIIEFSGLKPVSPQSVTDPETFLRDLAKIRRQGYAVSVGEGLEGGSAVAAPVFDRDGRVVAAVSVRGPDIRMPKSRITQLVPLVVEAATRMSRELGHKGKVAQATVVETKRAASA